MMLTRSTKPYVSKRGTYCLFTDAEIKIPYEDIFQVVSFCDLKAG